MRRGYADTPAGQVFYLEEGQGTPLLMLHQSPRSSSMFTELMNILAPAYRGIAIDLPGYGDSDPPPLKNQDTVDNQAMARAIVSVLDALGIARAHIFGFHTGAFYAACATIEAPARFGALVLGGFPLIEDGQDYDAFWLGRDAPPGPPERSLDGSHLMRVWMSGYSEVQKRWLVEGPPFDPSASVEYLQRPTPHRKAHMFMTRLELQFLDRWMADIPRARHMGPVYRAMIGTFAGELLPHVSMPTLHIEAGSLHESPFCRRGDRVAELIPVCTTAAIPDADDNMVEFQAERVAKVMIDFLEQHALG